jgi:hypothetical protein
MPEWAWHAQLTVGAIGALVAAVAFAWWWRVTR